MRLSKKVIPEPKWQLKVLFIFLELRLFKTVIKTDKRLLLWNQSKNNSWKFFSSSLKCYFQKRLLIETIDFCSQIKLKNDSWTSFWFFVKGDFQKKWLKNRLNFCCEVKAKMIFESHFHSPWIATFKEGLEIGQFDSCLYCKAKQKWRPFHFIELWLSKIATLELESKAKITHESSLQFIGLRLDSSHNRSQLELNGLTETHQILVVGFLLLPSYLLLLLEIVCLFCFKMR